MGVPRAACRFKRHARVAAAVKRAKSCYDAKGDGVVAGRRGGVSAFPYPNLYERAVLVETERRAIRTIAVDLAFVLDVGADFDVNMGPGNTRMFGRVLPLCAWLVRVFDPRPAEHGLEGFEVGHGSRSWTFPSGVSRHGGEVLITL